MSRQSSISRLDHGSTDFDLFYAAQLTCICWRSRHASCLIEVRVCLYVRVCACVPDLRESVSHGSYWCHRGCMHKDAASVSLQPFIAHCGNASWLIDSHKYSIPNLYDYALIEWDVLSIYDGHEKQQTALIFCCGYRYSQILLPHL